MSKKSESREHMPRRTLLKSALMVLGASVIVQPSGAVFGLAQDKKDEKIKAESTVKTNTKGHIKGETAKHSTVNKTNKTNKGTQKVKTDRPKKEG